MPPPVIARSSCDEAIQEPRADAGPLDCSHGDSRVNGWFPVFHVVGFLMWRRRGLDGRRAPVELMEADFFRRLGAVKGRSSPEATRMARP